VAESFYMRLRGTEIEVVINRSCGPEPDVGIMSRYVDGWEARDPETGAPIGDLTEVEENQIQEGADQHVQEDVDDFYDE
jgi:hypothetical protein